MHHNQVVKEWYSKSEILEIYPIGLTTYKNRIKKLRDPKYKLYTRVKYKILEQSNLKAIEYREIHYKVLDDIFGNIRVPNLKNKNKIIKWVNNNTWDWFGDIVPGKTFPSELIGKMNYVYSAIKKSNKECKLTLFYSIEKNTEDDYYHSHFLIKNEFCELSRNKIIEILELVAEKNTSKETRIFLRPYDYKNFGKDGSNYTLKEFNYGYDVLN